MAARIVSTFVDQRGQITLALGHGEAAGRQRDAGHGVEAQRALIVAMIEAISLQKRGDLRLALGRDVGDDDILVGRQPERPLVRLRDRAQAV